MKQEQELVVITAAKRRQQVAVCVSTWLNDRNQFTQPRSGDSRSRSAWAPTPN